MVALTAKRRAGNQPHRDTDNSQANGSGTRPRNMMPSKNIRPWQVFYNFRRAVELAALLAAFCSGTWAGSASAQMEVPGSFAVGATGAATYSIPIQVPPGIAGMTPSLSLSYSSQAGNGIVGMGWSLNGIPSIGRCAPTIAQDGAVGTITYTASDRFCMNGNRLVVVNSGVYGADGTEYRTEIDTFSRIVSHVAAGTGLTWFQVWTKAGQILEFGNTPDSQIMSPGITAIRTWSVDKISDYAGNYQKITYGAGTSGGEVYPMEIDYAFSSGSTQPYNKINFLYAARPDVFSKYQSGAQIKTSLRLTDIVAYSSGSVVSDYRLGYQTAQTATDTGRSQLTNIQICPSTTALQASCLPATTLTSSPGDATLSVSAVSLPVVTTSESYRSYFGNFTGSGRQEILWDDETTAGANVGGHFKLWKSTGTGSFANRAFIDSTITGFTPILGDFDGDGLTDILWDNETVGVCKRILWQNVGDGNFQKIPNFGGKDGTCFGSANVVDINGDGLADIVWLKTTTKVRFAPKEPPDPTITSSITVWMRNNNQQLSSPFAFNMPTTKLSQSTSYRPVFGHFQGTSQADILWIPTDVTQTPYFSFAQPDGTYATASLPAALWNSVKGFTPIPANFGNDSNTGILWYVSNSAGISAAQSTSIPTALAYLWIGQGNGNFTPTTLNIPGGTMPIIGDFDGDGRLDIMWDSETTGGTSSGTRTLWLGNGDGTFNQSASSNVAAQNGQLTSGWHASAGDFLGVGKSSILWTPTTGSTGMTTPGTPLLWAADLNPPPDLLINIATGLGAQTQISYAPLNNSAGYTQSNYVSYPTLNYSGPIWVSTLVNRSDGIGALHPTSISYSNAAMDLWGRGFLGFGTVTQVDGVNGNRSVQIYNQQFPLIGQIAESQFISSGVTVKDTTTSYTNKNMGSRYLVLPSQVKAVANDIETIGSTITSWALPTSTVTYTHDYDVGTTAYGDLTKTVNSTTDGFTKEVDYTPLDIVDSSHWILGLSTATVTTNTATPFGSTVVHHASAVYDTNVGDAAVGRVKQSFAEQGDATYQLETDYGYDGYGNTTSVTVKGADLASRQTTTAYDSRGQFPTTVTQQMSGSVNLITQYQYDTRLGLVQKTTQNGTSSSTTYDSFGRKTLVTAADGTRVSYAYNYIAGQYLGLSYNIQSTPQAASGAQIGAQSTAYYDVLGRNVVTDTQGFDGATGAAASNNGALTRVQVFYDTNGNAAKRSRPFWAATPSAEQFYVSTFDTLNRPLTVTAPDSTLSSHDYRGLTSIDKNANSQTLTSVKNSQGEVVSVTDVMNNTTTFAYDADGHQTSVTDTDSNVVSTIFDIRGRKKKRVDPDMGTWTWAYAYNSAGRQVQVTDNKGQVVTKIFDLADRPIQRNDPDSSVSTWTYDTAQYGGTGNLGVGKLAAVSNTLGYSESLQYDALGRPIESTQIIGGTPYSFITGYDSYSRVANITYPSGFVLNRSYTALGYGLQESESGPASAMLKTINQMDAELRPTWVSFGNSVQTSVVFDARNGELDQISTTSANGAILNFGYGYDSLGNILTRSDGVQSLSETMTYTPLNQLASTTLGSSPAVTYTYDEVGNLKMKSDVGTFTYGPKGGAGPHQLKSATVSSSANYAAAFAAGTERTYTWTWFNMPATVSAGGRTIGFTYDPGHHRIMQTSSRGTTTYLNDPISGASVEMIASGVTATWNNYFSAGEVVLTQVGAGTATSQILYFHRDLLGSTAAITDSSGNAVQYRYDAWGARRYPNGATDATGQITSQTDKGFTGLEELSDVGLVHMNARLYDPLVGRFVSADPTGLKGGPNVYRYASNNPMGRTDPTGLDDDSGVNTGSHLPRVDTGCSGCTDFLALNTQATNFSSNLLMARINNQLAQATQIVQAGLNDLQNQIDPGINAGIGGDLPVTSVGGTPYSVGGGLTNAPNFGSQYSGSGASSVPSAQLSTNGGSSSSLTNLVPGAYYGNLAGQAFSAGNYGTAAMYEAAGMVDAAIGIASFGEASLVEGAARGAITSGVSDTIDLYRAVGVREFNSVMDSGAFLPAANSLEGRQFALTMGEALSYADADISKVAILRATIDRSALGALDFSNNIDPFIFKNGVVTVQPGVQSDIFHAALRSIDQAF